MNPQKLIILGFMYINIGRPQDVLEFLKPLSLGYLFGGLTLLFILFRKSDVVAQDTEPLPQNRLILLLFLWMLLTAPFSDNLGLTFRTILELLKTVVLYVGLFLYFRSEEDFEAISKTILFSVLTLSVTGLFRGITTERTSIGTFYDPNDLALVLISCIPFVTYHLKGHSLATRLVALAAIIATIIQVLSTQSRMGFVLLILAAVMFALGERSSMVTMLKRGVIVAILAVAFVKLVTPEYMLRIQTIFDKNSTGSGRTYIWKRGLQMANSTPLVGVGYGAFNSGYGQRLARGVFTEVEDHKYNVAWKAAHNTYLKILAEIGYPGLILYLLLVRRTLRSLKNYKALAREAPDRQPLMKLRAVEGSFFLFLVGSFFLDQAFTPLFFTLTFFGVVFGRTTAAVADETLAPEDDFAIKDTSNATT